MAPFCLFDVYSRERSRRDALEKRITLIHINSTPPYFICHIIHRLLPSCLRSLSAASHTLPTSNLSFPQIKMMGFVAEDVEESRLFGPDTSDQHRLVPKSKLVVYDAKKQVFGLQMYSYAKKGIVSDPGSFVVYIDGACRNNGTPSAQGSWGVYFGPGSRYNRCGLLSPNLPQTNSRAEIEALVQALEIIHEITKADYSLTMIKIATDSEYLANAMSLWIEDWIENDGINAKGRQVAHFETLKALHERLEDMTYGDDGGLEIMFWPIPREENTGADKLANEAFEQS